MSQVAASSSSSSQHMRNHHSRDLPSSAVRVMPSSIPRRSTRIAAQRPADFIKETVEQLFANIPPNQVLTEESRRAIIDCFSKVKLQFDPALLHVNPEQPGYISSSYNAELGKHVAPRGGFGPPQAANGSFYHHHAEESFAELHPNVDLDAYNAPGSSQGCKVRSRTKSRQPRAKVPAIIVTDATDVSEHDSSKRPAKVAADGRLKVGVYKARSALASKGLAVNSPTVKATTVKATAGEHGGVKTTAVKATVVKATAEKENDMAGRAGIDEATVAADQLAATIPAPTGEKLSAGEDAGIVMEVSPVVVVVEPSAAATSVSTAEKSDTNSDSDTAEKVSQDSAYESQERLKAIPIPDDEMSDLVANYGSSDDNSGSPHVHCDSPDVHCCSSQVNNDNAPVVPRNKLTPKKPVATRRSSHSSTHTTDSQPASDSSLGKHKRQSKVETNLQEPESKRVKAAALP